jgi:transcriptional regulator with XRE-family HTH domain
MPNLSSLIRDLRVTRGLTVGQVANTCHVSRSAVANFEAGRRVPDAATITRMDAALGARGELVGAWRGVVLKREEAARVGQILAGSVADSVRLLTVDAGVAVTDLVEQAEALPVEFLWETPAVMLERAVQVRSALLEVMAHGGFRGVEGASVQRALSLVSGTLAYAALDLGRPDVALQHVQASRALSGRLDDTEHLVWAAGTESLIRRFQNDFPGALAAIEDGLKLGQVRGTGRVRLLSGLGQCRANLGDAAGAHEALDWAARARERVASPDSVGGLYNFTQAKQTYYVGSSLIHLRDDVSSRRAIHGAQQAIDTWASCTKEEAFTKDAILCRLYQAAAHLNLGDLAGVAERVAPVTATPPADRISWVTKRLGDITERLARPPWDSSAEAADLRGLITSR